MLQRSENPALNLGPLALMHFSLGAEELFEAAGTVRPPESLFQAGLGSTLSRSRREERCPPLFDLRAPHLGHLALLSSCSARVRTVENFSPQDAQRYS